MSVKKERARARVAEIAAEEKTAKKVRRVIETLRCPKCRADARAVADHPFTKWNVVCTRPLSECAFAHEHAAGGEESREEMAVLLEKLLGEMDPRNKPATPRSATDLAGSAEAGRARIAELADRLGRVHGKTTALPLEHAAVADVVRLPWGILALDLLAPICVGRVNRLFGKKSTLKTTLCLRALKSAQRHCRHCKFPIVMDPASGERDCRCPSPRYWLKNEDDYIWLPAAAAIQLAHGNLPTGAKKIKVPGEGTFWALECAPPPHLVEAAAKKAADAEQKAAKKGKKGEPKKPRKGLAGRPVAFTEARRCEPMRCLWLDGEQTITKAWARANGVDTTLVLLIGAEWAEQSYASIEDAILTREFDFVVIDSTSVLEAKTNIEKPINDNPTVAARANVQGRFIRRYLSAAFEGLNARHRPTVLATSQVSMHGIGYAQHAHLAPTDSNAWEHALSIDIKMVEEGYAYDATRTQAIYGQFGFEVMKDKMGILQPNGTTVSSIGATGTIKFWLREVEGRKIGDSDDLAIVMSYARELGRKTPGSFITEGTKFTLYSPFLKASEGQRAFSRVGDLETFLVENGTVYDDLRERVLVELVKDPVAVAAACGTKKK